MREIDNGIEIYNNNGNKCGIIYFDDDSLYIAIGAKPICIKHVSMDLISQIGDFFSYYGRNYAVCAHRIVFPDLDIRIDGSTIYFAEKGKKNNETLIFESVGASELRKVGTWLRKRSKIKGNGD